MSTTHASRRLALLPLLCGSFGLIALMHSSLSALAAPAGERSAPVGSKAAALTFTDVSGKSYTHTDITAHKATVFLFLSAQCPVCNVYAPRLNALAAAYSAQSVAIFGVYSNRQESLNDITRSAKERGIPFAIIKDANNALANRLNATTTPQAIVLDSTETVRYRGRIDDNPVATKVTAHDLTRALDAILAGKPVANPETLAVGCAIRRVAAAAQVAAGVPTYAGNVAAILRTKCEGCHRDGEVAPFSLQTYQQASAWASDIKRYTQSRQMPPWKPAAGYGAFKDADNRILTDAELTTLAKWADAGAPQGDPKLTPAPRKFTTGWKLGEPDLVIQPEKEYHLAADGDDVYRNFVIKSNFTEDRYISGVEVRPGNAAVVHHVIAYIDGVPQNGVYASEKLDGKDHDGQPGFTSFGGPGFNPSGMMGGWAPGNDPYFLPEGVADRIPKGARIVIQVHYHKDGKPETDLTKLGVHFAKSTVSKLVTGGISINFGFRIPPGDSHYKVEGMWIGDALQGDKLRDFTQTLTSDQHILAVTPHMHLLGREMKVWATLPDGTEKPLVWIKDWDFNWQMTYFLKEPLALPKGSQIHSVAYFDNSSDNPRNPNREHPKEVGWGESTFDEMCIAFITSTQDDQHLTIQPATNTKTTANVSH